jgi:hypothetical protein
LIERNVKGFSVTDDPEPDDTGVAKKAKRVIHSYHSPFAIRPATLLADGAPHVVNWGLADVNGDARAFAGTAGRVVDGLQLRRKRGVESVPLPLDRFGAWGGLATIRGSVSSVAIRNPLWQ